METHLRKNFVPSAASALLSVAPEIRNLEIFVHKAIMTGVNVGGIRQTAYYLQSGLA